MLMRQLLNNPVSTLVLVTAVLFLLVGSALVLGQTPLGQEFQINSYTSGAQIGPAIATDSTGNFVVVWWSRNQDGSDASVYGRRYDSDGSPLGDEFRINTYTAGLQAAPRIAMAPDGNFVVVWGSQGQDGTSSSVYGQRYSNNGSPLGNEFQVNSYTPDSQGGASVAVAPDGSFVVVWTSFPIQDGGIFAQRFGADGSRIGGEFRVNTYTIGPQGSPDVATDANGNFVIVWESFAQDGSDSGIFGQRYAANGSPLDSEFQVNSYTTDSQQNPAIAMEPTGAFVVVWGSRNQEGSDFEVYGQRYKSDGSLSGIEFRVNTFTADRQAFPDVAADSWGNSAVVWWSLNQDGSDFGAFGQQYDKSGSQVGSEFQVNTYTTSNQYVNSLAMDANGGFVVVWESDGQDGSGYGIFGQIFRSSGFYTVNPCRVVDTRNADGPLGGPALVALQDRTFPVAGACGIPPTAKALSVNITVTQPTTAGHLRLHAGGTPVPWVSAINYISGRTRANNAIVTVSSSGEIAVYVGQASGLVHFILDVNGYFQ